MPTILIDEITGDPVLDDYNNTVRIDDETAFEQILDGLFHCDVGSELMNPFYGFDLKSAIRNSGVEDQEMYIESLVIQALDPQKEKTISKVDYVKAERGDDREMDVKIQVTSILNDTVTTTTTIG